MSARAVALMKVAISTLASVLVNDKEALYSRLLSLSFTDEGIAVSY